MFERIKEYFNRIQDARNAERVKYSDNFHCAAETGDLKTLAKHYDDGGDPKGALSRSGLVAAASNGNSAAVNFLLEKGVPARSRYMNKTAAQAARDNGHTDIADKLQNLSQLQIPTSAPKR